MKRICIPVAEGVELSVLVWSADGALAPILLVHGLASNARLWDGVAAELVEKGHPVAAVDQRGHGLSAKPDNGYDFDTLSSDLLSVITFLGWERRAIAAGQSMGGNVVLHLAAKYPAALRGLALVDGGTIELASRFTDWAAASAALAPPALAGKRAAEFEDMIRKTHPDWPEAGIAGTLANMEVLSDGTIRPWLSRENHMKILRSMWQQHPLELYPSVTVPVVLVMAAGGHTKRAEVSRAADALRDAKVHWVEADHDLHAQHPALIASLIGELA